MTDKPENPPAFPNGFQVGEMSEMRGGMSLRDYFASAALHGWMSSATPAEKHPVNEGMELVLSELSYQMADAMLKARQS